MIIIFFVFSVGKLHFIDLKFKKSVADFFKKVNYQLTKLVTLGARFRCDTEVTWPRFHHNQHFWPLRQFETDLNSDGS